MPVKALGYKTKMNCNNIAFYFKNKKFAYGIIILVYLIYLLVFNFLMFPVKEDEPHFWQTAKSFSHSLIPNLGQMSDYNDLNTPLPFIIFGQLEFLTGNGVILGRYLNLVLSIIISTVQSFEE